MYNSALAGCGGKEQALGAVKNTSTLAKLSKRAFFIKDKAIMKMREDVQRAAWLEREGMEQNTHPHWTWQ